MEKTANSLVMDFFADFLVLMNHINEQSFSDIYLRRQITIFDKPQ